MSNQQILLTATDIARLIPHHGKMCVLAGVYRYDAKTIQCYAISHRALDNPLRERDQLHAACGIEYAAQAMAVHGALTSRAEKPRAGRLASVRSVEIFVDRLDNIDEDLEVNASNDMGNENSMVYTFSVHAGGQLLLEGRATVMLLT